MPRPSQENIILEAALHCFASLGYDATRIKHIAEAAKVSEGALYRHYPSKEALAQALYTQYMQEYTQQLYRIIETIINIEQCLREVIAFSIAMYREHPDGVIFILVDRPQLMNHLTSDISYPLIIIESVIRDGQAQGIVREGEPIVLASIFLGCFLRPIIVSQSGLHPNLNLLRDTQHDNLIINAAWATLARTK
jgi:AcrR family transcriptional regulator